MRWRQSFAARPDVLNHNTETVRAVSRGAQGRDLRALARTPAPREIPGARDAHETGLMLGLGETREEVLAAMQDLAAQGTDILTLGQYLQPTREHLRSCASSIPMSLPNTRSLASRWVSHTWNRARSCVPRTTRLSRKPPPTFSAQGFAHRVR